MFRFTIRHLLWLMVVVGLSVGWAADRIQKSDKALAKEVARLDYIIDMQLELAAHRIAVEQMREEIKALKAESTPDESEQP